MKNKVVVFTEKGARVLVNPPSIDKSEFNKIIMNPDLTKVKGIPPHKWSYNEHNEIIPLDDDLEQEKRNLLIKTEKKESFNELEHIKYLMFMLNNDMEHIMKDLSVDNNKKLNNIKVLIDKNDDKTRNWLIFILILLLLGAGLGIIF